MPKSGGVSFINKNAQECGVFLIHLLLNRENKFKEESHKEEY